MTSEPDGAVSDRQFLPTLLLCLFLGGLGVHRFYTGKPGTGVPASRAMLAFRECVRSNKGQALFRVVKCENPIR